MEHSPGDITLLLRDAASDKPGALDSLVTALYDDLRRLAMSHLNAERADHTLQPTALVHEAYVKLVDQRSTTWTDRLHFFAIASRVIRRILIDHARERGAQKRGGGGTKLSLADHDVAAPERELDLVALDEALRELEQIDAQQARVVELRYFAGCTIDEIAQVMNVGKRTVDRDWQAAKAWLLCRIEGDSPQEPGHG